MIIAGCTTAPPRSSDGETAATKPPDPAAADIQSADTPPVKPPVNPLLVDASEESEARDARLAALSQEAAALVAGEEGYYLDVLFAQLRKLLGARAELSRDSSTISIILPATISFEVSSARLSPEAAIELDSLLAPIGDYDALLISVRGHTDATGPAEVNQRLSAQRALTVASRLQALDISSRRIMAIGYGASRPRASNDTPEGRQQNRRVELLLEPIVRHP